MIANTGKLIKSVILTLLLGFLAGFNPGLKAQDTEGADLDSFEEQFKKEFFSVGTLVQTLGRYEPGQGEGGFSVGNARIQVFGELDRTFGYQVQANFARTPALLDANLYYRFSPKATLKAGLFKTPFSYEYLMSAAATDFVRRATVVGQLAPNRQVGMQLGGRFSDDTFRYRAGVFNGNSYGIAGNTDDNLMYTGRLEGHFQTGTDDISEIVVGANISYENKEQFSTGGNLRSSFAGEQTLAGVDARLQREKLMLGGELIYSWMNPNMGPQFNPFGYQLTAAYDVAPETELLLRWDHFDADGLASDSELLLAGLNLFPTNYTKLEFNYALPLERDIEFSQVLMNLQISL